MVASRSTFLKETLKKHLLKYTFILYFINFPHFLAALQPNGLSLTHWIIILNRHRKSFLSNLQQHLLSYFHGHHLTFHCINNQDWFYLASNLNPLTWQEYFMFISPSNHQKRSLQRLRVWAFFLCDSLTASKPSTLTFFPFLNFCLHNNTNMSPSLWVVIMSVHHYPNNLSL